jgi:hypothetical protein
MTELPRKKSQKTPQRYERLLKGEISAKQYVKDLKREARTHRSAQAGSYSSRRATSA